MGAGLQLLRGGWWVSLASLMWRGTMFVASIMVARMVGREAFGLYTLVWATAASGAVFAGFALPAAGCKFLAQFRDNDPERAGRIAATLLVLVPTLAALAGVVYFFLAHVLAERVFEKPEITLLLASSALALAGRSVDIFLAAVLIGLGALRILAIVRLAACAGVLAMTYLLTARWALPGAVWAINIGFAWSAVLAMTATLFALRHKRIRILWRQWRSEVGTLARFSGPLYLVNILTFPLMWVGIAMLARQPEGALAVASFGVGNRLRDLVLFVPGNLAVASLALLPGSYESDHVSRFAHNVAQHLRLVTAATLALVVTMTGLAGVIIRFLYGEQFAGESVATVARMLVISCMATAVISAMVQVFRSTDRVWTIVFIFALSGAGCLVGVWLFVPSRGPLTLATIWLISQGIGLTASAIALCRAFPVRIYRFGLWLVWILLSLGAATVISRFPAGWALFATICLLVLLAMAMFCILATQEERQQTIRLLKARLAVKTDAAG